MIGYPQSVVTFYIYRVGWTYPARKLFTDLNLQKVLVVLRFQVNRSDRSGLVYANFDCQHVSHSCTMEYTLESRLSVACMQGYTLKISSTLPCATHLESLSCSKVSGKDAHSAFQEKVMYALIWFNWSSFLQQAQG